jgi:hypothetical protein
MRRIFGEELVQDGCARPARTDDEQRGRDRLFEDLRVLYECGVHLETVHQRAYDLVASQEAAEQMEIGLFLEGSYEDAERLAPVVVAEVIESSRLAGDADQRCLVERNERFG